MRILLGSFFIILSACTPSKTPDNHAAKQTYKGASCEKTALSQCNFINSPVKLSSKEIRLPNRAFPFYATQNDLDFIDARKQKWIAPKNTLTDGASIPRMFIKSIGDPRSPEFLNAATMHDSYCGVGNETGPYYHTVPWQSVHRMFYNGLRVGGTSAPKAKLMYAAVYLAGPRWGTLNNIDLNPVTAAYGLGSRQSNHSLPDQGVSERQLLQALARAKTFINAQNPSLDALETFMNQQETQLTTTASSLDHGEPDKETEHYTDPYGGTDPYGTGTGYPGVTDPYGTGTP